MPPTRAPDAFNTPGQLVDRVSELLGVGPQMHFAAYSRQSSTGCPMWEVPVSFDHKQDVHEIDLALAKVRGNLAHEPVLAYKSIQSWHSIKTTSSRRIVLCPALDQFDIVRFEWGDKAGISTDAESIIGKLQSIEISYGIEMTGTGYQTVEFSLRTVPQGRAAQDLIETLRSFCGSVEEGIANARPVPFDWEEENIEDLLAAYDFGSGRVALWFD